MFTWKSVATEAATDANTWLTGPAKPAATATLDSASPQEKINEFLSDTVQTVQKRRNPEEPPWLSFTNRVTRTIPSLRGGGSGVIGSLVNTTRHRHGVARARCLSGHVCLTLN